MVDVGILNLQGHFKDVFLRACDYVCGHRRSRRANEAHGGGIKR